MFKLVNIEKERYKELSSNQDFLERIEVEKRLCPKLIVLSILTFFLVVLIRASVHLADQLFSIGIIISIIPLANALGLRSYIIEFDNAKEKYEDEDFFNDIKD
ncbi:MAG: hypothetical protein GTO45_37640 [Candidatus Aminicenantes bacterium]|nr:hypothetical protein [Candidatus Aminicenantes bacterium]NIM84389.1 hypothetical protein [Candidatus Aminicenantes bacterium]NIN23876.1 hypothetical protein [Candidatus Aminicenantes bacterium]NIN47592.1 hypothetical protein [Candidatus Aminicenantes bacterium]NIN90512.1 hypothetical protein [Candidatus Aminicenantes bacterium]